MKFSMNGFRRQLHNDVAELKDIAEAIVKGEFYDTEDFVNSVNQIVTHSNVVNCVYNDGDEDFTDMSDLEIDHIDNSMLEN